MSAFSTWPPAIDYRAIRRQEKLAREADPVGYLVEHFADTQIQLRFVRDEGRWYLATGEFWDPDPRHALYVLRQDKTVMRLKGRDLAGLAERALRTHPKASVATKADLYTKENQPWLEQWAKEAAAFAIKERMP